MKVRRCVLCGRKVRRPQVKTWPSGTWVDLCSRCEANPPQ